MGLHYKTQWVSAMLGICPVSCSSLCLFIPTQVRKFRTLTELIMDAEEHVKNPYKGKKLKVLGRN